MITITNPDQNFVKTFKKKIKDNNGYCPNAMYKSPDMKCPCIDFRLKSEPGWCDGGLYAKEITEEISDETSSSTF